MESMSCHDVYEIGTSRRTTSAVKDAKSLSLPLAHDTI